MPLPEWMMIVAGDVDEEVIEDWNRWYDEVHLPEIVECPGFVRATRLVGAEEPTAFITVYELDSGDAMQSEEFAGARGFGPFGENVRAKTRLFRRHLTFEG